ncbi:nitroreductase [Xanthomonas hortorum]|uniref:nitroreductase n=1 Tax=Xanthomonas hortorum TaxID=56454 RepID=UPI001594B726|nr:nitroreductase [Xanthomonas hortorum]NHF65617.1 nitroreductase [Xanthomonas hortorum]
MTDLSFEKLVRARASTRHFLAQPVDPVQIQGVLEDAQRAPSNCNTQPWSVHIVSCRAREAVSAAMLEAGSRYSPDFSWDETAYAGVLGERRKQQGKTYYEALGIARNDSEGRAKAWRNNLNFFGAPHAAFLFMPMTGDGVRVASDVGMYAQTFLLSLASRGLAGVPQTLLGLFADPVRKVLGIDADMKLLFGISFGYPDASGASAHVRMGRAPLVESVRFHD